MLLCLGACHFFIREYAGLCQSGERTSYEFCFPLKPNNSGCSKRSPFKKHVRPHRLRSSHQLPIDPAAPRGWYANARHLCACEPDAFFRHQLRAFPSSELFRIGRVFDEFELAQSSSTIIQGRHPDHIDPFDVGDDSRGNSSRADLSGRPLTMRLVLGGCPALRSSRTL